MSQADPSDTTNAAHRIGAIIAALADPNRPDGDSEEMVGELDGCARQLASQRALDVAGVAAKLDALNAIARDSSWTPVDYELFDSARADLRRLETLDRDATGPDYAGLESEIIDLKGPIGCLWALVEGRDPGIPIDPEGLDWLVGEIRESFQKLRGRYYAILDGHLAARRAPTS